MKFVATLVVASSILFASLIFASNPEENENAEKESYIYESKFMTRIDHSKPSNQNLTEFVFHANIEHVRVDGPVYIYIKDINDDSTQWIESGLMVDIARLTGAILLTFDMRFFGRNRPTSDASFENLALLTVDQALADIAMFIRYVEVNYKKSDSAVILWGSGYGASLAAWARQRYPHLVTGSWASSGIFYISAFSYVPIEHLRLLVQGPETSSTAEDSSDFECRDRIRHAYRTLNEAIASGDGEYIADEFNLCHAVDTDSEEDVAAFYELIVSAVINYIQQYHFAGITSFCSSINHKSPESCDPLFAFAKWFRKVGIDLPYTLSIVVVNDDRTYCFDHSFKGIIKRSINIEWDQYSTDSGQRQWFYLQCTQLGGFLIANWLTWIPQSLKRDYHIQKCKEIFGAQFESTTMENAVKNLFLEFEPPISNILYTTGKSDPLGIFSRQYDSSGMSINIDNYSKSADLTSISVDDPPSLYHAKKTIWRSIKQWSVKGNERSAEDINYRFVLDQALMYRELWSEHFDEKGEWDDDNWLKVFQMMEDVAKEKEQTEEMNNNVDDGDLESEAEIQNEESLDEEMDDLEDMDSDDEVVGEKCNILNDDNNENNSAGLDRDSEEDKILYEAIIMVELSLKLMEQNRHLCELIDANENVENDNPSEWYPAKIFVDWSQPMFLFDFDDNFLKNCLLAKEWLEQDFFQLDFESELKSVDSPEFRHLYIVAKLGTQYDKYKTERGHKYV